MFDIRLAYARVTMTFNLIARTYQTSICLFRSTMLHKQVKPTDYVHHCKHDRTIIMFHRFFTTIRYNIFGNFGLFHFKFSKMAIFYFLSSQMLILWLKNSSCISNESRPPLFWKCLHFNLSIGIYTNAYLYIVYVFNVLLFQQYYTNNLFLAIKNNIESAIRRTNRIDFFSWIGCTNVPTTSNSNNNINPVDKFAVISSMFECNKSHCFV